MPRAGLPPPERQYNTEARYMRFVSEYIKDYNATQAYLRAFPGTKYRSAQAQASLLSRHPDVVVMIERQTQGKLKLAEITKERVIMELARLGFSDPRKTVRAMDIPTNEGMRTVEVPMSLSEMDEDTARAVKSIEFTRDGTKLTMHSKENALGVLAKITGAITPNNGARLLTTRASVVQPDDMLDEEIEAALFELETGDDTDESLIDMDDAGNPIMDDEELEDNGED